mgnify:CR=1 FL=1
MAKKGVLTTADYLPYEEYKAVLNKLHEDKSHRDELYFVIAFSTALRVSDIIQLRWNDVLDRSSFLWTEQKTGKTRRINLNQNVQKKLSELYELLGKPYKGWYLFKDSLGENITPQTINRRLKGIKDRYVLAIGNFSTHTFRKTFGRYVYEKMNRSQEALLLLCMIFNHSNPTVTLRYLGIRQDEINNVFESIEF